MLGEVEKLCRHRVGVEEGKHDLGFVVDHKWWFSAALAMSCSVKVECDVLFPEIRNMEK